MLGVPGVDVSKIDLIGSKQKESPAVSAPPLPSRRENAHSGSGRSFSLDTGLGTQGRTGADGTKKRRLGADFRNAAPGSEDWGTGFTHRSGFFSADASGSGTKPKTNQAAFASRDPSMPRQEKRETVWQRTLNTFLGGLKNSAAGFTDGARTLYEVGQGGRTRDLQDLRDSTARQLETAERQRDYLLEHPEAGDAETAQFIVDDLRRKLDAYDRVLNENIQQKATKETAKLADSLQRSSQADIRRAKEGLGWFGGHLVDAGASAVQLLGDSTLGMFLGPGGGTLPLALRTFGSGTMEARQGGGTLGQQLLTGGLFAGTELLTEKLSSATLPFKLVYGDGNPALEHKLDTLVAQAVRKFAGTPTGQRVLGGALQAGKSFALEGLEEFVGDWLQWQLPRLYGGDVNSFSDQLAGSLNSFFTGGLVGLFGAGIDPGTYGYGERENIDDTFPALKYISLDAGEDSGYNEYQLHRPSWRQSERDVGKAYPDYSLQQSFMDGLNVPYSTRGSVRPDFYRKETGTGFTGSSIEVKNYDVTSNSNQINLIRRLDEQYRQRLIHLPQDTKQLSVIDVRGQGLSLKKADELNLRLIESLNKDMEIILLIEGEVLDQWSD